MAAVQGVSHEFSQSEHVPRGDEVIVATHVKLTIIGRPAMTAPNKGCAGAVPAAGAAGSVEAACGTAAGAGAGAGAGAATGKAIPPAAAVEVAPAPAPAPPAATL